MKRENWARGLRPYVVGLLVLIMALAIAGQADAASKEEFITAIPQGNPATDSTFAQLATAASDWISIETGVYKFTRLEVAVYWPKSADIDTAEFIFRVANDPTVPIGVDSSTIVAAGVYQKIYTLDSLDFAAMRYWQVVVRLGVIDNTDALRTQKLNVYWRWLPEGETEAVWRRWDIPMVFTE